MDKTYSGEEYLLNYQELTDALDASIYTSQEQLEMMRSCRFDLRFEGLKTQTVFYPPFTASFFFINQEPDARNDSILLPKAQSVGFTYSFLCMDINWGSEKVQKLLRQEPGRSLRPWMRSSKKESAISMRIIQSFRIRSRKEFMHWRRKLRKGYPQIMTV